ncbi:hypothetical protein LG651_14100 [Tamlana sp. 62-3]|uniref:DNA mismatch repair proteins mutS family domain-containing protein n=1 Tax=Neotamlana sargassicola TaxID=2883125 RepID=A0A9X1I9S0_9FLAO|nr:hypothetical protein [Tamlana sargassicola]MCB4809384.1 hypothetical protein [Tamlana sargassicola]
MNNIKDLNIEHEILPIFNYSLNSFSKNKILEILKNPLHSVNDIVNRQNILKGFSKNEAILKDYSYSVLYVNEVYFFLNSEKFEDLPQNKIKFKLIGSKQDKIAYRTKLNQLVLFFHRINSRYFKRLKLEAFPEDYASNIKEILAFLSHFELEKYEYIIREKRLSSNHILQLISKINNLKQQELIQPFWNAFFLFEAYLAINCGIEKNNFTYPIFSDNQIRLNEFYHPLIKNPVKNSLSTTSNVIVLNGPNMSGKSTCLKALSLCIYFGHLGFGIPAIESTIPFFNYFSIEINKKDDILNGYSHFMTEVKHLKNVVLKANNEKKCFAVFDELFSGTNVEDGFEICKATINGLSKFKNSFFFISTHIQELKQVSSNDIENYFIDCELIENIPTFTYKLKKGWSDVKIGKVLFEKEGLNKLLK